MASGSSGFGGGRGGGGRAGRTGAGRRYTAAQSRRVTERYTASSRAVRRQVGPRSVAVPSRWFM